ncbi:uncharacterized protein LOC142356249 [Convolutriloba macropyga]|uniref:uncharacterized protein LOC142356249 n=1 Tax=Convolutriloba macropyga TaxID=536237 RepID=UPI003F51BDC1
MLKLSLLAVLAAAAFGDISSNDQPSYPLWPNQFTQNFTDKTIWPTGKYSTRATYIYDWTTQRYRVDRDNGRYDRYCGTNGISYQFENTPCSHIVVDGNRYLYYPEKEDCCFCCNAAAGCGVLKPDWLDGAKFIGNVSFTLPDGSSTYVYKWEQDGLQSNYYFETTESNPVDRVMLEIEQDPNEFMYYDTDRALSVDSSKLELPSICSVKKSCSTLSVCTALSQAAEHKSHKSSHRANRNGKKVHF